MPARVATGCCADGAGPRHRCGATRSLGHLVLVVPSPMCPPGWPCWTGGPGAVPDGVPPGQGLAAFWSSYRSAPPGRSPAVGVPRLPGVVAVRLTLWARSAGVVPPGPSATSSWSSHRSAPRRWPCAALVCGPARTVHRHGGHRPPGLARTRWCWRTGPSRSAPEVRSVNSPVVPSAEPAPSRALAPPRSGSTVHPSPWACSGWCSLHHLVRAPLYCPSCGTGRRSRPELCGQASLRRRSGWWLTAGVSAPVSCAATSLPHSASPP